MRLILEPDESWSIMTLVVSQVLDGVDLSDKARAAMRKWRNDRADGTKAMRALGDDMNAALDALHDEQTHKLLPRKGRYVSSGEKR